MKHSGTGDVAIGALPGAPKVIGSLLFHDFLLPFEITSILILIAIMGAVVLASKPTMPGGGAQKVRDLMVPLSYYLVLSGILFACGVADS